MADRSTASFAPSSTSARGGGYERLEDWAGVENLEERVDGEDAIDPVVLERAEEGDVSAYEVRRIDELEEIPVPDAGINWRPIRRTFGITAFGINAYTANEGEHVVEEHNESQLGHEEVYVVIAGRARFTLGGDDVDVGPGRLVYLRDPRRPSARRSRSRTARRCSRSAASPASVRRRRRGSGSSPRARTARRGDYDRRSRSSRRGSSQPDNPILYYHVADYKALLGRTATAALEHLRTAVENAAVLVEYAREDDDFDSLRDDPEFLAITGEPEPAGGGA